MSYLLALLLTAAPVPTHLFPTADPFATGTYFRWGQYDCWIAGVEYVPGCPKIYRVYGVSTNGEAVWREYEPMLAGEMLAYQKTLRSRP